MKNALTVKEIKTQITVLEEQVFQAYDLLLSIKVEDTAIQNEIIVLFKETMEITGKADKRLKANLIQIVEKLTSLLKEIGLAVCSLECLATAEKTATAETEQHTELLEAVNTYLYALGKHSVKTVSVYNNGLLLDSEICFNVNSADNGLVYMELNGARYTHRERDNSVTVDGMNLFDLAVEVELLHIQALEAIQGAQAPTVVDQTEQRIQSILDGTLDSTLTDKEMTVYIYQATHNDSTVNTARLNINRLARFNNVESFVKRLVAIKRVENYRTYTDIAKSLFDAYQEKHDKQLLKQLEQQEETRKQAEREQQAVLDTKEITIQETKVTVYLKSFVCEYTGNTEYRVIYKTPQSLLNGVDKVSYELQEFDTATKEFQGNKGFKEDYKQGRL